MVNVENTMAIYFRQIVTLNISHNLIKNIESKQLVKACPYIEIFNFSYNLVSDLNEIIPLGKMKYL